MLPVLTYHSRTFELLGAEPRVSAAALEMLEQVDKRIGRVLPASVREWYELDGARQLLLRFSNDDPPLHISDFGKPLKDTAGGRTTCLGVTCWYSGGRIRESVLGRFS